MEYALFFGAMALSYGVVHWVGNCGGAKTSPHH